jgi:uncharacterized protein
MHGQFVWYELTTPDVEGAKKFYPQIASWGTQAFDNDYTMWTQGGAPFAGIFRLNDEMKQRGTPPNWMPYVETDNVNSSASKASSLGGKVIVQPTDIPGTGRFAVLQDPQGATFGVYKSNGPSQGWAGDPSIGRFSWHELMTTDYQKAKDFYRKLFNWATISEMDMGPDNKYSMFGQQGKMFGGMFNRTPEMGNMPPFWLVYIYVKDIKKSVDAAVKAGAQLKRGPMDIPGGGKIAILGDPQGAAFALHQGAPEGAATTESSGGGTAATSRPAAKKVAPKKGGAKKAAAKKKSAAKKGGAKKKSAAKKGGAKKKSAAKKGSARRGSAKKAGGRRGAKKKTSRRR